MLDYIITQILAIVIGLVFWGGLAYIVLKMFLRILYAL